jgi:urease accessory protein UreH
VEQVAGQSAVTSAWASSPLKLLTPRPRGTSVWSFLSSFGGGLVAGDETRLDLRVDTGARCFVGTQASTKVYRNPDLRPCGHELNATLGEGALLVLAPDPVQAFAGSSYKQRQEFRLAAGAGLVLVDWFSSGRAACGERWAFNRFQSRNEVWREKSEGGELDPPAGQPGKSSPRNGARAGVRGEPAPHAVQSELIFLDSLLLTPDHGALTAPHRMGRFDCLALVLLVGAPVREGATRLLADVAAEPVVRRGPLVFSASPIRDGALLRLAGDGVENVDREIRRHLAFLAELLGDDPWARKR